MQPYTTVRGSDDVVSRATPARDDPIDGLRLEIRAVREDDDGRFRICWKRLETAAERRPGSALPVGAADGRHVHRYIVRAEHDEHGVELGAARERREHLREELRLLRRRDSVA